VCASESAVDGVPVRVNRNGPAGRIRSIVLIGGLLDAFVRCKAGGHFDTLQMALLATSSALAM